ncbi:MAG TPA: DUF3311 domain-containing protein [Pseudonocardiaceae bacterium]|jgi:hypothetical protein
MSSSPPDSPPDERRSGPRFNPWNLLLLVPLLMLITPWFNSDGPRFIGLPFFYWYQFAFVVVGVACVWIVYAMTRKPANRSTSDDAEGRS